MILKENELKLITGGTITATFINAVVKGISLIAELGKSLGSTIRRITSDKTCKI